MWSAVYSNAELEKAQKQELTLALPASCFCTQGFTILFPLGQLRWTNLCVCVEMNTVEVLIC